MMSTWGSKHKLTYKFCFRIFVIIYHSISDETKCLNCFFYSATYKCYIITLYTLVFLQVQARYFVSFSLISSTGNVLIIYISSLQSIVCNRRTTPYRDRYHVTSPYSRRTSLCTLSIVMFCSVYNIVVSFCLHISLN